jgi:hypothetical protein
LGTISTDISGKQDKLVDGVNIATINGQSLTEGGDLTIESGAKIYEWFYDGESESVTLSQEEYDNIVEADIVIVNLGGVLSCVVNKSGKEFAEAIGYYALTGQFEIQGSRMLIDISINISTKLATIALPEQEIPTKISQLENDSNFVSSDNLKTINGESIVGSGDITVAKIENVGETPCIENVAAICNPIDGTVYGLPGSESTGDADDYLLSAGTVKTINGQPIVGSGDIEISGGSGGGEDIRYFTEFTVEDFIEACEIANIITYDTTELFNAMKSNKVICVPYRGYDKGFIVASYKSDENVEYPDMYLQKGDVEYYAWTGDSHELVGECPTFNSIQCVEIAGGEVFLEILDNYIYRITDPVDYLVPVPGDMQKGTTIHFMSGEFGTTIEMYNVGWANGEIPQIEPNTQYELSLMTNSTYTFNAVLIPFKEVE